MTDRIPLIEPVVGEEELSNIEEVIQSGYMTQGPFSEEFEDGFAELVGTEHGITATSCTTGMELALEAAGIGDGDEVLVPDFTHPATGNAVERVGAEPVLVDVDRWTYNMDMEQMLEAAGDADAVLPVSWGGQPLDPEPFDRIADEHDVPVIEDAACSVGARYDDEYVGSQFDASVFSFHPRKVLTTGEGGMITTDSDDIEQSIREIKNFGADLTGEGVEFVRSDATNLRFSDILGAVGVAQLEKIEEVVGRRRDLAHAYEDLLEGVSGVTAPEEPEGAYHNFQSYCVYVEAGDDNVRNELIDAFGERGIETQIGTYALHATPAFKDAKRAGDLDTSLRLHHGLLTLPVAHSMTQEDQHRVVKTLDELLSEHR